jgi:hypothetical protein
MYLTNVLQLCTIVFFFLAFPSFTGAEYCRLKVKFCMVLLSRQSLLIMHRVALFANITLLFWY